MAQWKFSCFINRHRPIRHRVREADGDSYTGFCKHCGEPIRRVKHGVWKREQQIGAAVE